MIKTRRTLIFLLVVAAVFGGGLRHIGPRVVNRIQRMLPAPDVTKNLTLAVPINGLVKDASTGVEEYWGQHTVNSTPFKSAHASLEYLDWRFREYPLFDELMEHFGKHDGEMVLDYGCGPGNDLVGFLVRTNAKKIIGMDISKKALSLASHRLSLHENFDLGRVALIQVDDAEPIIPLASNSVDFIYSEGVVHHTSNPDEIVKEFHRILKPGGKAAIMVYNGDSLWKHLYVAYKLQLLDEKFADLSLDEAFTRSTDGENCPIALNYTEQEFGAIGAAAGFKVFYKGGFFSRLELDLFGDYHQAAKGDPRLPEGSRAFLNQLETDIRGFPTYHGKHVGVGGVYFFEKAGAV